jgi:hypothetical protein
VKQDFKNFTFFQTLYLSFFSRALYQDAARNWKGLCFPYLLFLLMLYWVPETLNMHRDVSDFLSEEAPHYVDQIPVITISKGEASIQEPSPYYIRDKKNGAELAIIDLSGKITDMKNTSALILLTRTKLMIRKGDSEVSELSLSEIGNVTITSKLVYNWIEFFNTIFVVILFPFLLFMSFLFYILQVLLCAVIGGQFTRHFNIAFDFRTRIRLSVVAFTPAILLNAAHALLDIRFPYSVPVSFLVTLGYLYYAVGANSETMTTPDVRTR